MGVQCRLVSPDGTEIHNQIPPASYNWNFCVNRTLNSAKKMLHSFLYSLLYSEGRECHKVKGSYPKAGVLCRKVCCLRRTCVEWWLRSVMLFCTLMPSTEEVAKSSPQQGELSMLQSWQPHHASWSPSTWSKSKHLSRQAPAFCSIIRLWNPSRPRLGSMLGCLSWLTRWIMLVWQYSNLAKRAVKGGLRPDMAHLLHIVCLWIHIWIFLDAIVPSC